MILNTILLLGFYLGCSCVATEITPGMFVKSNPICDVGKRRMIINNELLRWRISHEVIRNEKRALVVKRINIRNITKLCNKALSSYYAYLCSYYSITPEDKYLLEFIISATY